MTTREAAFSALFAKLSAVTWGGGTTWAHVSRRLAMFGDVAQPSLMLTANDEAIRQKMGADYFQVWKCAAMIYHSTSDLNAIPQQTDNAILDAIFAAMAPDNYTTNCCTLGGLVTRCSIEGTIHKFPGDLDGQSMIVIPFTLVVP